MSEIISRLPYAEPQRSAVNAAQDLVQTALDRLDVITKPELQAGPPIRRITLQSKDDPRTLHQVVERATPGWPDGNLWIHTLTDTTDPDGETKRTLTYKELPRTGSVTEKHIKHLIVKQPDVAVADNLQTLAGALAEARQVPDNLFVIPTELYRKQKKKRLFPSQLLETTKPHVTNLFDRAKAAATKVRLPQRSAA